MSIKRRIGSATRSSPKILSTEFLIQNHADIIGTVIVIITVGLMFESTGKYASKFVALQHNTTDPVISFETGLPMQYTYGIFDLFCILFYSSACIVGHGVIQQYLLDRSARKLHLSKVKYSKFNESGQLLIFYSLSLAWALELLRRDHTIDSLQGDMTYGVKLYYIIQIAYWLHCFPEFQLQKIRKEEIAQRSFYVGLYLASYLGAYLFGLTKVALVLVVLHYAAEAAFHLARLSYFSQKESYTLLFKFWNVLFVVARLASITLSVLVFALGIDEKSSQGSPTIRFASLAAIFAIQVHLMWKYLVFHLGRIRPQKTTAKDTNGKSKRTSD